MELMMCNPMAGAWVSRAGSEEQQAAVPVRDRVDSRGGIAHTSWYQGCRNTCRTSKRGRVPLAWNPALRAFEPVVRVEEVQGNAIEVLSRAKSLIPKPRDGISWVPIGGLLFR